MLATGARERFLPFPGWTLPGVLGVGAAQALLKAGARFAGTRRVVVAGSGPPLLVAVAAALAGAGARVVGIAEQAPLSRLARFAALAAIRAGRRGPGCAARLLGVPYRPGAWVRGGREPGRRVRVALTDGGREWAWDCDVLACAFGLVPNLELAQLLGCATDGERVVVDDAQQTRRPGVFAAGELCGIGGVDQALVTGAIAGLAAAGRPVPEGPAAAARARACVRRGPRRGPSPCARS